MNELILKGHKYKTITCPDITEKKTEMPELLRFFSDEMPSVAYGISSLSEVTN